MTDLEKILHLAQNVSGKSSINHRAFQTYPNNSDIARGGDAEHIQISFLKSTISPKLMDRLKTIYEMDKIYNTVLYI